jgi:Uma2 family endonuclease
MLMLADVKFPLTNDDLAPLVDADGFYRLGASVDDYWQLLEEATYRADYYDHQIITTMSYESDIHSGLAAELGFILKSIFSSNRLFKVYNSNRPVYIEDCAGTGTGVFSADGMVISLPGERYEYRPRMSAETTPTLLIEILSNSTRAYDFGTKLPCYKQIPSLQQMLFVEQHKPEVIVFERQAPNRWTDTTLRNADDSFTIAGQDVSLRQIYQDVFFGDE